MKKRTIKFKWKERAFVKDKSRIMTFYCLNNVD